MKAHPAADAWPMLTDEKLQEMADSIREEGLIHAVVLDKKGRILDGRNRIAACEIAGVEPRFDTYEGDASLYIIAVNGHRRHQSLPEQAAAVALTLALDGKRNGGRWEYGAVTATAPETGGSSESWTRYLTMCGLVLDYLGEARLKRVAHGKEALDAAVQHARKAKAEEERAEALRESRPDLAERVDAEELTVEEAERIAALPERHEKLVASGELTLDEAEHLATREEREYRESIDRAKSAIESFLYGYTVAANLKNSANRDDILGALSDHDRERFLTIEKEATWPTKQ